MDPPKHSKNNRGVITCPGTTETTLMRSEGAGGSNKTEVWWGDGNGGGRGREVQHVGSTVKMKSEKTVQKTGGEVKTAQGTQPVLSPGDSRGYRDGI